MDTIRQTFESLEKWTAPSLGRNNYFNSFLAGGDICHLLITFANSLDPSVLIWIQTV